MAVLVALFLALVTLSACTPDVTIDDDTIVEGPAGPRGPRGLQGPPGPAVRIYSVESDTTTEPGQHIVTAVAECEDGDQLLAGGCSWGEVEDPHDVPLRPLVDAPEDNAWKCEGQNAGVGVELKTITSSAVCIVGHDE